MEVILSVFSATDPASFCMSAKPAAWKAPTIAREIQHAGPNVAQTTAATTPQTGSSN